jgi:hypothetical protein
VTTTKTRSELGASNLSKGKAWMYVFAVWMQHNGFSGFEIIAQNGRADGAGLTDWTIELKNIADPYKLFAALRQVMRDQAARGTPWHVVIKKVRYRSVPNGLALMSAEQLDQIIALTGGPAAWNIGRVGVTDGYDLHLALDNTVKLDGARWHAVIKESTRQGTTRGLAVMTIGQWAEIARLLDKEGL